ncbi:protein TBATA isoform X1 [Canis lupus familiaris]|uniref:protein TBATA isoform X1 n=1 Tax=Canis lupus familiaris TaxID=9615 RepID=UPI0018F7D9DE|nr:protein TBATA isoform X1 [Canis lupus familiaris]
MATDVKTQLAEHPLMSPRAELKPEKKSGHRPRSHGDNGPQKELMIPGIVDFQLIQTALKTPKPQTPGAYRFGRLSHHSFFSRHHPHPQRVTHIQGPPSHSLSPFADLTGKPVCVVRDEFSVAPLPQATLLSRCLMGLPTISVPIGDPQSNREPRLSSGLSMPGTTGKAGGPRVSAGNVFPEAWKKELRDLASRVAVFTKENELKSKEKEEPQREQGAKYSAETGRLIPTSTRVIGRRHSRQGPRMYSSGKDEGVQTVFLKDHELLGGLILPGIRFSGPVGRGPRAVTGKTESRDSDKQPWPAISPCHPSLYLPPFDKTISISYRNHKKSLSPHYERTDRPTGEAFSITLHCPFRVLTELTIPPIHAQFVPPL